MNTLLMQMYAYESNGQPTFYLAVGEVMDNKVTAALNKYTGGRYFGSGSCSSSCGRRASAARRCASGSAAGSPAPARALRPAHRT